MNKIITICCAAFILHGCASERIVTSPTIVEVPGPVQYVPIPPDFLVLHQKSDIPENLTWSEAAQLWAADRETIDILIGNLLGIKALGDPE